MCRLLCGVCMRACACVRACVRAACVCVALYYMCRPMHACMYVYIGAYVCMYQ